MVYTQIIIPDIKIMIIKYGLGKHAPMQKSIQFRIEKRFPVRQKHIKQNCKHEPDNGRI